MLFYMMKKLGPMTDLLLVCGVRLNTTLTCTDSVVLPVVLHGGRLSLYTLGHVSCVVVSGYVSTEIEPYLFASCSFIFTPKSLLFM